MAESQFFELRGSNPSGASCALAGPPLSGEQSENGDVTACWLEIGVYGKGSCVELKKHIHCRNCPVYSSAGVRLLDRPLPEGYRWDWTLHFAQEKQKGLPPARTSVVIFRIDSEWLALPARA